MSSMAIANQEAKAGAKPAYRARKNEFNLLLFENSKRVGFYLPSFPAVIPVVLKTGYSRAARGHSRTVTFGFDALLGLVFSHVFYSPILCASVWFSY
jgi:hypothetical protein